MTTKILFADLNYFFCKDIFAKNHEIDIHFGYSKLIFFEANYFMSNKIYVDKLFYINAVDNKKTL